MFKGINVPKPKRYWLQAIKMLEEAKEQTESITACHRFGWLLLLLGLKKKKKAESLHDSRILILIERCYTPNTFPTVFQRIQRQLSPFYSKQFPAIKVYHFSSYFSYCSTAQNACKSY